MPHDVVVLIGPARCGKTHWLLQQYRDTLRAGASAGAWGPGLWLAPTSRGASAVRQQLLTDELGACLEPGVMTLQVLADRVLTRAIAAPRQITPVLQRELLQRVVQSALEGNQLAALADAARRASFIDMLNDHFDELRRRGIRPNDFAKSIGFRGDRRQHEELSRLYNRYQDLLDSHQLCDRESRHWAVRDALAGDPSLLAGLELVVADGFTDFTHTQHEILRQLGKRAGRLMISLPGDGDAAAEEPSAAGGRRRAGRGDLFAKSSATLAELRRYHPQLAIEQLPPRPTSWPALDHVAHNLFRHPREIPDPSPAAAESLARFEIVAAAGVEDEIVQVARRIKQRLIADASADGAARPGDIAVVFRALQQAAPRVRAVFTEFGIPHSLEARPPLMAAGIVRTVLAMLRLDGDDWPFNRVVSVVTNNMLTAIDRRSRAQTEWLVRDLQIAAGRQTLLTRVEQLAVSAEAQSPTGESARSGSGARSLVQRRPSDHRERRAIAAAAALPALRLLAGALDELPTTATPREWTAALVRFGERLGIAPLGSSASCDAADSDGADAGAAESLRAWQCMADHVASLEQLAVWLNEPAPQLGRDDLLRLLVDIAAHESLPSPSDDVGRVRVLSATTARTVEAEHLFLAGMSEQSFPSPERVGRFYSESDYRFFANVADQARSESAAGAVERAHEEMLLFYEVLTRAGARLTISYPAMDEKAQVLPPSPYVTELERTLGGAKERVVRHQAPRPAPLPVGATPLGPTDWRIQAVHRALEGDRTLLAGLWSEPSTAGVARSLDAAVRIIAARGRSDAFSGAEGLVESEAVRRRLAERFGASHLWSPSQWEKYARCPYHFLLEEVLRLEPLGELTLETDARRRGSFLHHALADFHRELHATLDSLPSPSQLDEAEFMDKFQAAVASVADAMPQAGVDGALVELDRRQIMKWASRYYQQHATYDREWARFDQPLAPAHFEFRFGPPHAADTGPEDPGSTELPFVLTIGHEEIRVTGRIDRIDVGRAGGQTVFNVIDYKSGNKTGLTAEQVESGERLQPALYVMAAQQLLFADEQAVPLFAGYWSMEGGPKLKTSLRLGAGSPNGAEPSVEWESLQGALVERIGQFIAGIRQGDFPVISRDDNCTSYCPFCTVCRVSQIRSLAKQWLPEEPSATYGRNQ